ncbi:M-phase inducer phosphatase [Smittium culicis]|uniref:M-phase inducer phosphatase n=1 Tax=Smittium culicis TaxID=133412 RepID=A0A1R1XER1_9FUNG|nr:M-phase inducer phosphatase [Smittium culicis]
MSLFSINLNDPFSDNSGSSSTDSSPNFKLSSQNTSYPNSLLKKPDFSLKRSNCLNSTTQSNNDVSMMSFDTSFMTSPCHNKRKFTNDLNNSFSSNHVFDSPSNNFSVSTPSITSFPRPKNESLNYKLQSTSPCISLNPKKNRMLIKQRTVSSSATPTSDFFSESNDSFAESPSKPLTRAKSQSTSSALDNKNPFLLNSYSTFDSNIDSSIPSFSISNDPIKRIEPSTMSSLIDGKFDHLFDQLVVVDCRFPYEFKGGHINTASNSPSIESLEKQFLSNPPSDKRVVIVFHCEYSIKRAPSMARHLRKRDRELNILSYPNLFYPHIYVLQGGYSNFFVNHSSLCFPQKYVTMDDDNHADDCKQLFNNFERQFKRSKSNVLISTSNDLNMCSPTNYSKKLSRTKSSYQPSFQIPFLN